MSLVRIALIHGRTAAQRRDIGEAVHRALVDTIGVPLADRFQVITEHEKNELVYDPHYLGIRRSDGVVMVQSTLSSGRTLEAKRALQPRRGGAGELVLRPGRSALHAGGESTGLEYALPTRSAHVQGRPSQG